MRGVMDYERYWINVNWIKINLWIGTFSDDEKAAFKKLGNERDLCMIAWMTQRWCRIGNPDKKPVVPCDPDLRKAISLMKKLGVPWDRMLPSDYD